MKRKRSKKYAHEADDTTPLSELMGFGPTLQTRLKDAGYAFRMSMSAGDFKKMAGSYESLESKLRVQQGDSGYALNMLRTLWDKKARTEQTPHFEAKAAANMAKEGRMEDVQESNSANRANFLLQPHELEGRQAEKEQEKETPEIDALQRIPDPTKAVPLGNIQNGPLLSVVPDTTLNVSPDDKGIYAPMEVLPDTLAPLIPAAALGVAFGGQQGSRMVAPQSLEEKQMSEMMHLGPERTKANEEQDMGQDGRGDIVEDAKVGQDYPMNNDEQHQMIAKTGRKIMGKGGMTNKTGRFTMKPYGSMPAGSSSTAPPQQKQDDSMSRESQMHATKHPFKQPSLFANHDRVMARAKALTKCSKESMTKQSANMYSTAFQTQDASFYKYNPATQGVQAPYMPPSASNYLQRGPFTTDFQMLGPNPLFNQFPPCPYLFEKMSGPFR